jgi:hypothetical protein
LKWLETAQSGHEAPGKEEKTDHAAEDEAFLFFSKKISSLYIGRQWPAQKGASPTDPRNETMRREIEFKMRKDDGTKYEIRVDPFGGKFKFQFKDLETGIWDYERKPTREELEMFLDIIQRRYNRRRAAHEDVVEATKLLDDHLRDYPEEA